MVESQSGGGPAGGPNGEQGNERWVCEPCGKSYTSHGGYKYHLEQYHPEELVECPKCGDLFMGQIGMKQHHSREHGESLAGELTACEWCGDEYRATADTSGRYCSKECATNGEKRRHLDNRIEHVCEWCGEKFTTKPYRTGARFCGYSCQGHWLVNENGLNEKKQVCLSCERCGEMYSIKPSLAHNSRFCSRECKDGPRSTLTCEWCGKEYSKKPSHAEGSRFCSRGCQWEWQSENMQGELSPRWAGRIELVCENCDKLYEVEPHRAESRFCSKECKSEWQIVGLRGENNPSYKGGHDGYYGPNWGQKKREARQRDGYRCQGCGLKQEDHWRALSVHHITRIGWYKDRYDAPEWWEKGNQLHNLVTMCVSCHKRWEGLPLRPMPATS